MSRASSVCLASVANERLLWHRRLGHASTSILYKLRKRNLVNGSYQNSSLEKIGVRDACQVGKQTTTSFKAKWIVSTIRPLELIHFYLFGLTSPHSLGGKSYYFVIVDNYSRITWTLFFAHKDEAFEKFLIFFKKGTECKGIHHWSY